MGYLGPIKHAIEHRPMPNLSVRPRPRLGLNSNVWWRNRALSQPWNVRPEHHSVMSCTLYSYA
jgi:hypothetical protein